MYSIHYNINTAKPQHRAQCHGFCVDLGLIEITLSAKFCRISHLFKPQSDPETMFVFRLKLYYLSNAYDAMNGK